MTAALAATGVAYAYPDGRVAVDDASFLVAAGESVGLIGPNGAGKTTLLHLLAGLLPPRRGEVLVFGERFGGARDHEVRRRIGIIFQETEDQLFSSTLFDDVAFGLLNFGFPLADVKPRVAAALEQVGLAGFEERVPHHLSSGERRRAAMATVLAYDPEVVILDEPSNDLDARGRRELIRILGTMRHARIVASHDLELIARTCARVLVLDAGRIAADGPAADVLCDGPFLERHGLRMPLGLCGLLAPDLRRLLKAGD